MLGGSDREQSHPWEVPLEAAEVVEVAGVDDVSSKSRRGHDDRVDDRRAFHCRDSGTGVLGQLERWRLDVHGPQDRVASIGSTAPELSDDDPRDADGYPFLTQPLVYRYCALLSPIDGDEHSGVVRRPLPAARVFRFFLVP